MLAEKIGVEYFTIEEEKDPLVIINAAKNVAISRGINRLIIDTAGRLHVDEELMNELKLIESAVEPDDIFFVADSSTGQDAVNVCREFAENLNITGIILTKMDGDARGGAAMSIAYTTGKSIVFVGIGEKMEDFEPFYPDRMASRILGMGDIVTLVEKAQKTIDEKTAMEMEKKLKKAEFDFDDFLTSFNQLKKMGPLNNLLKMIPGMSSMGNINIDEKELLHIEALIKSMTKEERKHPEIIDGSRKKRIAKGAGRSVEELNRLLKRFLMMKKMMKKMGKMSKKMPSFMKGMRF